MSTEQPALPAPLGSGRAARGSVPSQLWRTWKDSASLLAGRAASEQGGGGARGVWRVAGGCAGIKFLLGAQQRGLGVHIPAGAAFQGQEHVLGPAVHQAVQEPLRGCGESLGESTGKSGIWIRDPSAAPCSGMPGKPPLPAGLYHPRDREMVLLLE